MSKLKVMTKKDGFRRAGFTFREQEPTIIDIETLPKDTRDDIVKALKDEPMLIVVEMSEDGTVPASMSTELSDKQAELDKALSVIKAQESKIDDLTSALTSARKELEVLKSNPPVTKQNNKK